MLRKNGYHPKSDTVGWLQQLTIQNGSYQEAQDAIGYADNLPEVRKI
ncbi:hypothetical protein [Methanobacterium sp. CWC-01]|nr:hypothetical protein [Methanobacterium sp. CWC-01]